MVVKENVLRRVFEHAEFVNKHYESTHTRFFTALQGSQNYCLDDAESDVDTKTLVIPKVKDLILNKLRVSTTLLVEPTIEHADVKDMREMFNCFTKQNINFLEILFTPYVDINPIFIGHYNELYCHREDIAHLNPYRSLRAIVGDLIEKYYANSHPSNVDTIEKYGYDPKQLHYMIRLKEFLIRFFQKGESYESCLTPKNPAELIAVKRGSIPLHDAQIMREDIKVWADRFLEKYKPLLKNEEDPWTRQFMDDVMLDAFMTAYKKEGL